MSTGRRSIRRPTPGKTLRAVSNVPKSTLLERARRLPFSGPGRITTIPLELYPAYLELHHLVVPQDYAAEVTKLHERGIRKPDGVIVVRRIKVERKQA